MSSFESFFDKSSFRQGGCSLSEQQQFSAYLQSESMGVNVSDAFANILCRQFNTTYEERSELSDSVNGAFMLANTYLVFFMQAGFAMLCAGSVRTKNCMNILLKNVLDACFGAPVFFLFGYGLAYGVGTPSNSFIGNNDFALVDFTGWHVFLFQWAFAAATATIVSGSVAERCTFQAYIAYSMFLTGFVYPVIVHWIWCDEGFLTAYSKNSYDEDKDDLLFESGMIDFGGSGVVHMTGGLAGLTGAFFIGPRSNRFLPNGTVNNDFSGHNVTLVVLGTFVLWFGWYGFNPGAQLNIATSTDLLIVGRAAVTTTLSGATGGITSLFIAKHQTTHWDLTAVCNGILAGLVGITAGCAVVEPAAAILSGFISAFIFEGMCNVLLKLKIDDPLSAAPMHGFCGMWGLVFVGLLAKEDYVEQAYGRKGLGTPYGVFYGSGGGLLGCQIVGILSIMGWTIGLLGPFFYMLSSLGQLRVPPEDEDQGLDRSHHGGTAYARELIGLKNEPVKSEHVVQMPTDAWKINGDS